MLEKWANESRAAAAAHRAKAAAEPTLARDYLKRAEKAEERAAGYEAKLKAEVREWADGARAALARKEA